MILFTVGTHTDPFDRLVRAAAVVARGTDEEVVVQRGTSTLAVPGATVVDHLPPSELAALIERARIVVCHAGPATIFAAAEAGTVPIVVPRRPEYGEHVDDHQVVFTQRIADRVDVVEDLGALPAALASHTARWGGAAPRISDPRTSDRFAHQLSRLVGDLVAVRGSRRRAVHARFREILRLAGLCP